MERIDLLSLQDALGIHSPWVIKSATPDNSHRTFELQLEIQDKKKLFGLIGQGKKEDGDLIQGAWMYQMIGGYRIIVKAAVPIPHSDVALTQRILAQSAFLGHPQRRYSNYLRQQIALAQIKGFDAATMASIFQIDEDIVANILDDLSHASTAMRSMAYLPTEVDAVWEKVLSDQILIKTSVLPLKLLLSKLKLASAKNGNADERFEMVVELRKFFVANAHLMDNEIDQLCGLNSEKMQQRVRATKSQQRLVLPSLKNPLWLDLLSSKLKLNSQSVPLNLLISRQRKAFIQGRSTQEKINAIEILREYFRKNYRTLKAELVLLNRAMEIRQKSEIRLPDADHNIWQRILVDDNFVPSNHIAYKLLLAKLRSQITSQQDPVIRIEAARRIRNFIAQNQKSMRQELNFLLARSNAV